MEKNVYSKITKDHVNIAKYLFKGLTISEIAQKMCCSKSNVSYKMSTLFSKYKVKNRFQFVVSVFSEILDKNKLLIDEKNLELAKLEVKLEKLQKTTQKLIKHENNKENYDYWKQEIIKQL